MMIRTRAKREAASRTAKARDEVTAVLGLGRAFELVLEPGVLKVTHQEWRITKTTSWSLQHVTWPTAVTMDPQTLSATVRGLVR
jgi:hypothetical protein